ncbi:hypothetical protein TMM008_04860 [Pseudomonas sp. 008]|nr:hypothetical protein TMM008_04860 [Pseudomonas sp. 008]
MGGASGNRSAVAYALGIRHEACMQCALMREVRDDPLPIVAEPYR